MTTKNTTATTELRRCTGSWTFGIEPHEAPVSDFPVQPSRKDGLGVMCRPHWTEYTRALRQAAKARKTAVTEEAPAPELDAVGTPEESELETPAPRRAPREMAEAEPEAEPTAA